MTEINTCAQGSVFANELGTLGLTMDQKSHDFANVQLVNQNELFLKQQHKIIRTKTSRDVLSTNAQDTAHSNKT